MIHNEVMVTAWTGLGGNTQPEQIMEAMVSATKAIMNA